MFRILCRHSPYNIYFSIFQLKKQEILDFRHEKTRYYEGIEVITDAGRFCAGTHHPTQIKKGVSEYQMSYDLGRNKNYVRAITSGRSLPSVKGLFDIIEYFDMTPSEFFDSKS